MKIVMAVSNVCFSIASFIAWFMPNRIKQSTLIEKQGVANATFGETVTQKLGKAAVMAVIDYLGDKLAILIDKSPDAAKGLLLLSIDEAEKATNTASADFKTLHDAVVVNLKNRLEQIGISDVKQIVNELADYLVKNQSLFVMLSL